VEIIGPIAPTFVATTKASAMALARMKRYSRS
jgi:hypothetical protein